MGSSQAWKALEKLVAKMLGGKRISRGDDFSRKDVDVEVEDFDVLRIDAKYRSSFNWAHHAFLDEIKTKYCTSPEHIPVLVTKNKRQRGACLTVQLDHFGVILDAIRELRKENERLRKRLKTCRSTSTDVRSAGRRRKKSTKRARR